MYDHNLVGKVFGKLTCIERLKLDGKIGYYYRCKCDCGGEKVIRGSNIIRGSTRSCGCLWTHGRIHGLTETAEHKSWDELIYRCTNPNGRAYKNYGGRGIKVCDRWLESFENFLADMGNKPTPKHSIDRINNNGNYEPSNCRWATRHEQSRNTRRNRVITYNGITMCMGDWAKKYGLKPHTLRARLESGKLSFQDAITMSFEEYKAYRLKKGLK